jgi:hypothetical protein
LWDSYLYAIQLQGFSPPPPLLSVAKRLNMSIYNSVTTKDGSIAKIGQQNIDPKMIVKTYL